MFKGLIRDAMIEIEEDNGAVIEWIMDGMKEVRNDKLCPNRTSIEMLSSDFSQSSLCIS